MRSSLTALALITLAAGAARAEPNPCIPEAEEMTLAARKAGRRIHLCVEGRDSTTSTCRSFDPRTRRFAVARPSGFKAPRIDVEENVATVCRRGKCRKLALKAPGEGSVFAAAGIRPDGKQIAVVWSDGQLEIRSARTGKPLRSFAVECSSDFGCHNGWVSWLGNRRLAMTFLAGAEDGQTLIVDARTGKTVYDGWLGEDDRLNGFYTKMIRLAGNRWLFLAGNRWLFIDGERAVVRDVRTGKARETIDLEYMPDVAEDQLARPQYVRLRGWRFAAIYPIQRGERRGGRIVITDLRRKKVLSDTAIPRCKRP